MAKRKNGEGSFGTRKINGTTYKYYKFPDGHFVYGKTATDRDKKIEEYKAKLEDKKERNIDAVEDKHITLGEYAMNWLRTKFKTLSGATYDNYYVGIESRVIGFKKYPIGNMQLISLNDKMFEDYLKELGTEYSKATVNKTWMILKQVLRYGMKNNVIPKINIDMIKTPSEKEVKVKKKVVSFITPQDMERLYSAYKEGDYPVSADVVIFIMYSGARVSEATAIKWKQISEDFTSVTIDRAMQMRVERDEEGNAIKGDRGQSLYRRIEKDPKSEAGRRTVPLPKRAQEILKERYEFYKHNPNDLVFPSPTNTAYDRGSINRMIIKLEKAGGCSTHYAPHELRHGYGSILISKGVDIKIVSELLGHADVTTTYNIYIGVLKEDKINAVKNVFDGEED